MKKILITTFVLIIHYSLLIINCLAQWQPDVRLTNSPEQSFTSFNNAKCIAASGDTLHAVWFDNRDGNYEIYYKRSINAGLSWGSDTRLTNESSQSFNTSIAVSGGNVHIVWDDMRDGNTRIYYKRSSNGGASWGTDIQLSESTQGANLPSIAVNGQNIHVAWTDYRHNNADEIYYKLSTNGGASWGADTRLTNFVSNSSHPSISVQLSALHIVWEDDRDGNIEVYYKRSTDNGSSWGADVRLTNHPDASHNPCTSVLGQNVHIVWYDSRNNSNQIYYKRSTDGGLSWGADTQLSSLPAGSMYPSVTASNSMVHVVWTGSPGFDPSEIYNKRSTNDGLSWESDVRLTVDSVASNFPSVCFSGSYVHVLWHNELDFGNNCEIFYTRNPTGNVMGIINISSEIPEGFSLSQNYPNPFNPMTKLKFQMPNKRFVKLAVYDILGREMETLVNENLHAGTYEVDFDGSKYPSGVYFYQLIADGYSETKKMLMVK